MNISKLVATAAIVGLSGGIVAGCGGSGESPGTSAATTKPAGAEPNRSDGAEIGRLLVVGGGSSSFRVSGRRDNSAVSFGSEAPRRELKQAAAAMHGYLVARVREDWPRACSYLSRSTKQWIERAAVRKHLAGSGCAAHLDALGVPLTGGIEFESSEVEAGSLRAEDGRGFLFYFANAAPFKMPMEKEGRAWKVANVEQTALACSVCHYNQIR